MHLVRAKCDCEPFIYWREEQTACVLMSKPSCSPVSAKLTAEFIQSALQDCSLYLQLLLSSVNAVLTLEENKDWISSKNEQHAKAKKEIAYGNRTQYMFTSHTDTDLNPSCDCPSSIQPSPNFSLSSLVRA